MRNILGLVVVVLLTFVSSSIYAQGTGSDPKLASFDDIIQVDGYLKKVKGTLEMVRNHATTVLDRRKQRVRAMAGKNIRREELARQKVTLFEQNMVIATENRKNAVEKLSCFK